MFEPIEELPRTPAGRLRNPWVDTAGRALVVAAIRGYVNAQINDAIALYEPVQAAIYGPIVAMVRDRMEAQHRAEMKQAQLISDLIDSVVRRDPGSWTAVRKSQHTQPEENQ